MRRGVLVRFIMFVVAALAAIVYLTPNFVDQLPLWWSSVLPSEKIHLGLDLQGGTHLILEVQVDKAVEHNIERVRNDLVSLFRERGLSGISLERVQGTQLQIKVPADSVERVRGVLKGDSLI
jgi:preprotein translocase subunit SecD